VVFGAAAVVTALTAAVSGPARAEPMPGGYVEMVVDDHVRGLGEWAVRQHNKESGEKDDLQFGKVVKAEGQVVNGMNYNLFIDGKDSRGAPGTYLTEVYEKAANRPGLRAGDPQAQRVRTPAQVVLSDGRCM
jgi:hypothetical protein